MMMSSSIIVKPTSKKDCPSMQRCLIFVSVRRNKAPMRRNSHLSCLSARPWYETWETSDQQGRVTRVSRFAEVHVQQDRVLTLSVIRVEHTAARGTTRDPRVW